MGRNLFTPGDYIHDRRREAGMTQGQLAKMLRLSDSDYHAIERDERQPSDETILAIARVLRMNPRWLMQRYGRPYRPAGAL
jgi:transcriptional regulator with XRE-family HTH domain